MAPVYDPGVTSLCRSMEATAEQLWRESEQTGDLARRRTLRRNAAALIVEADRIEHDTGLTRSSQ